MPYAGSVNYEIKGLSYLGDGDQFQSRVGFHLLTGLRAKLFDNDLLPHFEALEKTVLPRVTDEQRKLFKKLADAEVRGIRLPMTPPIESALQDLKNYAPLPPDSAVGRSFTSLTDHVKNSERHRAVKSLAADVSSRWDMMRKIAREIPRKWSDESGEFEIGAQLVGTNGENVVLKRTDSRKVITVPLSKLSEVDKEFTKTFGLPVEAQ